MSQTSVFLKIVEMGGAYVDSIINLEGELSKFITSLTGVMENELKAFRKVMSYDLSEAHSYAEKGHFSSQKAAKVQFWTSKLSADSNQADNMKTLFNSTEQATTQVLSKFGTDQSNFVQEMEGGILPEQQVASLLGAPYA